MGEVTPLPERAGPVFNPPSAIISAHDTNEFFSGHECLDDWLKNTALKVEGRTARTYVVTEGPRTVVGYYCVATGAVRRSDAPGKIRRNSPDPVPIAIIGRLAVTQHRQGQGIGGGMLRDALQRIAQISKSAGCAAVIVHAIDQEACGFYTRYNFVEFPSGTKTLFLPIDTLIASL